MSEKRKEVSSLEKILSALDPQQISKKVVIPHRRAKTKWKIENPQMEVYEDFRKHIIGYMQHHWKEIYQGKMSEEEAFGHAHQLLEAVFRDHGGYEHAFDLAREGKLDEVIGALSSALEQQATTRYISHHVKTPDPHDLEGNTKLVRELFDKYKTFLPAKAKLRRPEYYANNPEVLIDLYRHTAERIMQQTGEYTPAKKKEKGKD